MLKKEITFDDLDGNSVTEEFLFHLSKADLIEIESDYSGKGGLENILKKIVGENDNQRILAFFKQIVLLGIGKRAEDGKQFIKTQEYRDYFTQTNAYSELLMEMFKNPEMAGEMINGMLPKGLETDVAQIEQAERESRESGQTVTTTKDVSTVEQNDIPAWKRENREPTPAELQKMSQPELLEAFKAKQDRQQ